MTLVGFAFWGLLGAFVYAAPRLLVVLAEKAPTKPVWIHLAEFLLALCLGPIGASAFTPIVAEIIGWHGDANLRATALVVGMVANPIAPTVVNLVGDMILHRLYAPLDKPRKPK
jgi:hypothetical protein